MRKLLYTAIALISIITLYGCHPYEEFDNTPDGNLEALWTLIDEHYCFFQEKGIDWNGVYAEYQGRLRPDMTQREMFDLCAQMLDTLHDGHVNLVSSFAVSYYRDWWSAYPQDFNLRTLQENYLQFDYMSVSGILYKIMPGDIAYIYIGSFSSPIGESNLDWILHYFKDCKAIIIDVRDNGGGLLSGVETLVSRFIDKEIVAGYIRHKTGPGHNDFSEPMAVRYKPAETGRIVWPTTRPVVVVTNRSCFSAANDFVSVMKSLPNVVVVGVHTGGGSGMPFSGELPNGWSVRFSACPMTDISGNSIESGVAPTEGCEVNSPATELAEGIDRILDFALKKAEEL